MSVLHDGARRGPRFSHAPSSQRTLHVRSVQPITARDHIRSHRLPHIGILLVHVCARALPSGAASGCSLRSIDAVQTHSLPPRPSFRRPSVFPCNFPVSRPHSSTPRPAAPGRFPHIITPQPAQHRYRISRQNMTQLCYLIPLVSPILPHASQHVVRFCRQRAASRIPHITSNQQLIPFGSQTLHSRGKTRAYVVVRLPSGCAFPMLLMKLGFRNHGLPRALECGFSGDLCIFLCASIVTNSSLPDACTM